jgi:hypothetical protein
MQFKKNCPKFLTTTRWNFAWNEQNYSYTFKSLSGKRTWNNTHLMVDGIGLSTPQPLTPVIEDIINLLFGGASLTDAIPAEIEEKCTIDTLTDIKRT